ncbi:hypothetical protein [Parachitinimonas caeni]|uniref:DUF6242 domain-containing protein n=1 Tax=Parachitinimonas caeni TaxID=3031301 RepID=A0ABT7DVR7_9NEIS|nr:hypothetical protein [Parachitinimonas caeni]MDK2124156.1 hypothetical protein [Parachitinimonas caeni]
MKKSIFLETFRECYLHWCLVLTLLLSTGVVHAGVGNWRQPWLVGEPVNALIIDRNGDLIAGTRLNGIYISKDGGENWNPSNNGLENFNIRSLFKINNGDIFAVTGGDKVYRSFNNGVSWSLVSFSSRVNAITSDLVGGLYFGTEDKGLFKSNDNGNTWFSVSVDLQNKNISSLILDSSGDIYAAGNREIVRSSDHGKNWIKVSSNFKGYGIYQMASDGKGNLYVGAINGLYKSGDKGNSWTWLRNLGDEIRDLVIDSNDTLYVTEGSALSTDGIHRSFDYGATWTQIKDTTNLHGAVALVVDKENRLYSYIESSGIFKSNDNGNNWNRDKGINLDRTAKLFDDSYGNLFITSSSKLYKSSDGGLSWVHFKNFIHEFYEDALVVNSAHGLFVGLNSTKTIYRSVDDGKSWEEYQKAPSHFNLNSLLMDKKGNLFAITNLGIYKSAIGQRDWNLISPMRTYYTAFISDNGNTIAAIGYNSWSDNHFIAMTVDGGATWGNPYMFSECGAISVITMNSQGDIFAGTQHCGILRREAKYNHDYWNVMLPGKNITSLTLGAKGSMYAGTNGNGVWASNDGLSWLQFSAGLGELNVNSLLIDKKGTLYALSSSKINFTHNIYSNHSANNAEFEIKSAVDGTGTNPVLAANIKVGERDEGMPGFLYIVASYGSELIQLSAAGWIPLKGNELIPYMSVTLGSHALSLLNGDLDVSAYKGMKIYAGYGRSPADLIQNQKYKHIYTVQ